MASAIPYVSKTWEVCTGCSPDEYNTVCRERCWAAALAKRFPKTHGGYGYRPASVGDADCGSRPGCRACGLNCDETPVPFSRLVLHPDRLSQPLKWRAPQVVFVVSRGDLFHDAVPDLLLEAVFGVMSFCGQQQFLVLTKRLERMRRWLSSTSLSMCQAEATVRGDCERHPRWRWNPQNDVVINSWPLPNVWLGVSVWDQASADRMIPELLAIPAAHHWLSLEPLLGPIDLSYHLDVGEHCTGSTIDWVIAGCESGPGRRPAEWGWFTSLRNQCDAAGVPLYLKQATMDADWYDKPTTQSQRKVLHFPPTEGDLPPAIWRTLKGAVRCEH